MNFEIERKFLVKDDTWRQLAIRQHSIRQAYLDANPKVSVRVRIRDNSTATLTLKSSPSSLRRLELEYPIPTLEAEALIPMRQGTVIEKTRYIVPCGKLGWEVDEFSGDNAGLIIAEIELPDENHSFELPPWIGTEVTGQRQYYNGALALHPYGFWTRSDAAMAAKAR